MGRTIMVSFIISLDNSYAMTENFFAIFLKNKFVATSEVIVVLDGVSNENIITYCKSLEKKHENVKLFYISKVGYGKANNFGVQQSTGEYIYFINSDIFAEEDCFEKMHLKLTTENVACVQPLLIYPQTNLVQCAGTFFGPYFKDHLFDGNKADAPIVQVENKRQALTSALYAMRKDTFLEFGGFDEFYYNKLESFELSYKLTLAGRVCLYLPSARAWHSRGGGRSKYTFDFRQQESYFWTRYGPSVNPDISNYLNQQINENIASHSYYTVMMSQIRSWKDILSKTPLQVSQYVEMPWISPGSFNLWDIFPSEIMRYKNPLALIVESIRHLHDNSQWFKFRNNPCDIAIDSYANVVNISDYIN